MTTWPRRHMDCSARFPAREVNQMEPVVSGVSQMSQSTMLLKKRKEMREIDDALDFMKEEFMQRMDACDARQRELERKQTEMKEQVARFEKFIKENDTKRTRAEVKTKSEHRLAEVNDQRKRQLLLQLEKDLKERKTLEKKRGVCVRTLYVLKKAVRRCVWLTDAGKRGRPAPQVPTVPRSDGRRVRRRVRRDRRHSEPSRDACRHERRLERPSAHCRGRRELACCSVLPCLDTSARDAIELRD